MTRPIEITFTRSSEAREGLAIVLASKGGEWSKEHEAVAPRSLLERAARAKGFEAEALSTMELLAPEGSPADRIVVVGLGAADAVTPHDWLLAGGAACAQFGKARSVTVFAGAKAGAAELAGLACGMTMRAYDFDGYKTKKPEKQDAGKGAVEVRIVTGDADAATKAFDALRGTLAGVELARNLVNEPANVLGTVEFAERAQKLNELGVEVEVLTEKAMKELGMNALLGVAQGSVRPPRLVVMQWKGAGDDRKPVAFIGKGVVFDSGGISIKSAGGMEDMKGDMGGAAAVTGLMHALAARKAKVNAVGIIGLVENMPDGNAQRPGDIVRSMSGQTVEIINTDAEGRLVLCDALWYCQDRFKPQFMVNLATLTGAIIVALGHHHAGLFCNDDRLAERLTSAGLATREKLWRMPLGPEYDKLLESKFADMKHTGGRAAGSITAAQFLKRFVNDTPWAHLDIAGTAIGSPQDEINQSWASGFGVRLLDELVRASYES